MTKEPFPLSSKYKDFFPHEAEAEFLEGTTSAGKTTTAVPKFMLRVAKDKSNKPSIISGLDLGTVEKNILNTEVGLLAMFGNLVEYNPKGKGKIRLPHLVYNTSNGKKILYILGYDNVKRWKKALGGQYFGLYIDELNIADMDFVREAFMRADYKLCTMNPDDPNKECYTQFVNKARPIEKYKNDAPEELLKMLNEPANPNWTWWYFTFDDNLSLTPEKKQRIIESVPAGTKLWKNKIKGLRGRATGLALELKAENIINEIEAKSFKYIEYVIGCDTSYSKKTHDKLTFEFIGITEDGKCVLLEEQTSNNKDNIIPFAPSDVIPNLVEFANFCRLKWGFAKNIFIDSADAGTLEEAEKYKRVNKNCLYNFIGSWKDLKNEIRVQLQQTWIRTGNFLVVNTCKDYIAETNLYSYTEEGTLEDRNDHSIQGVQYAFLPYRKKIGDWSIIKQLIKEADY